MSRKIQKGIKQILFNQSGDNADLEKNTPLTYAVIDAAMSGEVHIMIQTLAPDYRILLEGEEAEVFEEAAPYLVQINKQDNFTDWMIDTVYAKNAVCFIKSTNDIETLSDHLKQYAKIQTPIEDPFGNITLQWVYFAFYDPRVFPGFIEGNTAEQSAEFFTGINQYLCESADDKFEFNTYHYSKKQNKVLNASILLDKLILNEATGKEETNA